MVARTAHRTQMQLGAYTTTQYTIKTPNLFSEEVSVNSILNQVKLCLWKLWTFFFSSSTWWFLFDLFCCRPAVVCLKSRIKRPSLQFSLPFWLLHCIICFYIISVSRLSPFAVICRVRNSSHFSLQLFVFLWVFSLKVLAGRLPEDSFSLLLAQGTAVDTVLLCWERIIYRKSFLKYFLNHLSF